MVSLKTSLLADCRDLDTFLSSATATLSTKPRSMADMTEAKRAWKQISQDKPSKHSLFSQITAKDSLLTEKLRANASPSLYGGDSTALSSTGSGADTEVLRAKWDDFEVLLSGFTAMYVTQAHSFLK